MSKFAVVLASAFLWSGALHAHDTDCCYEGTAEFETCRIHGEGDGHANDGVSGGHAQPGAPHGEEVEETCYDEFNIEIDCNDLEVGHHGEGDGQPGAPDGEENDAVEYDDEYESESDTLGYDDEYEVEETCYDEFNIEIDCNDLEVGPHGEGDGAARRPGREEGGE